MNVDSMLAVTRNFAQLDVRVEGSVESPVPLSQSTVVKTTLAQVKVTCSRNTQAARSSKCCFSAVATRKPRETGPIL